MNWILWLLIGLVSSALHLAMTHRALYATRGRNVAQTQRALMLGVPVRLLVLAPIVYLVVSHGLSACLAWMVGYTTGRLAIGWYVCWRRERTAQRGQLAS